MRSPVAHGRLQAHRCPGGARGRSHRAGLPALKPIVAVTKIEGFKYSEHPLSPPARALRGRADRDRHRRDTFPKRRMWRTPCRLDIEELRPRWTCWSRSSPAGTAPARGVGRQRVVKAAEEYGDLEAARKSAAVTVTREYRMNRQSAVPLEGRAILAAGTSPRGLAIYIGSQSPHSTGRPCAGLATRSGSCASSPRTLAAASARARAYPEEVIVAARR